MKSTNCEKKRNDEENESYLKQDICHACKKDFLLMLALEWYSIDHCHYTGKYREAAHKDCKLDYKDSKETSIVFHNGSARDYNFIIK